mgnify:CR=1 FL=1
MSIRVTRSWLATVVVLASLIPIALLSSFAIIGHQSVYEGFFGGISALVSMLALVLVIFKRERLVSLNSLAQKAVLVSSIALVILTYTSILPTVSGPGL